MTYISILPARLDHVLTDKNSMQVQFPCLSVRFPTRSSICFIAVSDSRPDGNYNKEINKLQKKGNRTGRWPRASEVQCLF